MKTERMTCLRLSFWLSLFLCVLLPTMASAQDEQEQDSALLGDGGYEPANYLSLGVGYFDVLQQRDSAVSFHLDWHPDIRIFNYIAPSLGGFVTNKRSYYGYFALGLDLPSPIENLRIYPSAAVGGYDKGRGWELGLGLEFRTGVELHYYPQWDFVPEKARLGLGFHHISNASIGRRNPGVEILSFTYAHPLDFSLSQFSVGASK